MFNKLKNWIIVKWWKFQFKVGLEKKSDYLPKNFGKTKVGREREFYAFLETNKDRFEELFKFRSNRKDALVINDIVNFYNNKSQSEYISLVESKFGEYKHKRTFASLFSKSNKRVISDRYKEAEELSPEIEKFLVERDRLNKEFEESINWNSFMKEINEDLLKIKNKK